MNEVINVEVRHEEVREENMTTVRMWLVNSETGEQLTDEEIFERFVNFTITGVHVKPKSGFPEVRRLLARHNLPGFGMITGYDESSVILNGETAVPKSVFHDIYRLD